MNVFSTYMYIYDIHAVKFASSLVNWVGFFLKNLTYQAIQKVTTIN